MNNDLISRSALLAEIKRIGGQPFSDWDTMGVLALAERIPAVDAETVMEKVGLMKEAFDMAKSTLAPAQKWISVKDRLPERSGDVLTLTLTDDRKQVMRVVSLPYSKKWKAFNADDHNNEGFVHRVRIYPHFWMPLPEPPKEG